MKKIELYNGDCLEVMDKLIEQGVKVDVIATDPPYKVTSRGHAGNSGGMLQKEINKSGNVFKHNDIKFEDYLPLFENLLNDDGHLYIMTNHVNMSSLLVELDNSGFKVSKIITWVKDNKIMGQFYMSQSEFIVFARLKKGKARRINNCGTSDVLHFPNKKTKDENGNNIHDTEKPVEMMKVLVGNSTKENSVVIDPFMGVGTTGIACKELGVDFIGIELDENYFNIAKERIANETFCKKCSKETFGSVEEYCFECYGEYVF